jgi:diguanylate cyclase (GGDEF)-like protein/PAS domain S-box-containing protein
MGWLRSRPAHGVRRHGRARASGVERVWAKLSGESPKPPATFLLEVGRPGSRRRFRFVAVNQAYRAHLAPYGIDVDTPIVGRTPADLLPADFALEAERRYEQVLASGTAMSYAAGFELAAGSLTYDVVLEPIGEGPGRYSYLLGVAHEREVLDSESALRDTERRFAALVEQSSDMIVVMKPDGRVLYASPSVTRVLGWSSGSFEPGDPRTESQSAFDIVHPDDVERMRRTLTEGLAERREEHRDEFRLMRTDGSWVWVDAAAMDRLDDPAIQGIVVNTRAITERKEVEARLRASEDYFRALVENASDYVIVVGPDGRYVYVSPPVMRFLDLGPDDVVRPEAVEMHPDDRDRLIAVFTRLGEDSAGSAEFSARLRRSDGEWREFDFVARRLTEGINAGCLVVNANDVTESSRALAALRESEERFRSAFEHAPIGMAIGSADGKILRTNPAFAQMLGRTPEALVSVAVEDLTHPDDWPRNRDRTRRMFAGEISGYQMEKRYLHADGSIVWCSVSVSTVRDADGTPLYSIAQTEDITERKAVRERLAHQAVHDPLTGLPNRASFLDRLEVALDEAGSRRGRVGVLFLDLDHFKVINDSLGHDAGDRLLLTIAHRLRRILRPTDAVARFGGDEFTILCDDLGDPDLVMTLAQRVLDEVARPILLTEGEVFVTTSIGIAVSGGEAESPQTLVRDADTAMYRAKDAGRARAAFFDERVRARSLDHLHTGNALHRALDRGEFEVRYQPILELETGVVTGFEALLRWQHPDRGLLKPIDFIALAEETGLIVPIGAWVLATACAQAARWTEEGSPHRLTMSVNLSPRQLSEPSLPGEIERTLERSGLDADLLWLEITETALMHDIESAASALRVLRSQGIHLVVDDFGTGYSSLSHLKGFPIEALKIDQGFIRGLGRDAEDTAIVTAVVSLAHALGLSATAEGVETPEQLAELRTLGCDLAQGHLFAEPLTAAELTARPVERLGRWADLNRA